MQAKDVMTVKVVSVSKDTLIHEVVDLLLKYRISAVPVCPASAPMRQKHQVEEGRISGPS